jgi:hypothetical protein
MTENRWLWRCALLSAVAASSCSSKASSVPGADEYIINCDAADGGATVTSDENYTRFIEADSAQTVVKDPCLSPLLTAPPAGTKLDPSQPPVFTFSPTHPTCALHRDSGTRFGRLLRQEQPGWSRALESSLALVVKNAEAHCGAISGENYLFRLMHAGEKDPVYSALLSVTSFTPDASIWNKAMAGRHGQSLTLTIERAIFLRGDINQGPYVQPQPYSFVVGP